MVYIDSATSKELCSFFQDPQVTSKKESLRIKYYLWFNNRSIFAMEQLGEFTGYCSAPPYYNIKSFLLKAIQRDAVTFGITIKEGTGKELMIFLEQLRVKSS